MFTYTCDDCGNFHFDDKEIHDCEDCGSDELTEV